MDRKRDLTTGNITKDIILFAVPIFFGCVFQNLYNSIDSAVVGRYVGKAALAAVTSCSNISNVIVGFFTGLATGVTVQLSRYFGAKKYRQLHDAIHTSVLFSMVGGIVMAVIGSLVSPLLLKVVSCPEDVFDYALLYLRLFLIGTVFTSTYNVSSSVLRSVGDSKGPFIYLVVSSITNVILDFLFVAVFQWGIYGVGIATIIAQMVSCVLVYIRLTTTDDVYHLNVKELKIHPQMLRETVRLGLPTAIQTCLVSLSNAFVQGYINSFGSDVMAGIGAANKIDSFAYIPSQSIGLSITTFTSQNLGAEKEARVKGGLRSSVILMVVLTLAITIPLYFLSPLLVSLFNDEPAVIELGVGMMRVILPVYMALSLYNVYSGLVRGYGYAQAVMIISMVGMIGARQLYLMIAMGIERKVGFLYWAYPVGWIAALAGMYAFYFFTIRKRLKRISPEAVRAADQ